MHDASTSIDDFLNATAARQPTPGGGSVAALAGALSAAIGEMAIQYSLSKKTPESARPRLTEVLAELQRARKMLLELMVEDQVAYESLTAARKLPETDATRTRQQSEALKASIRVPNVMAGVALAVLELAVGAVDIANVYLLSDLAVCCELAMATLRCAAYNVRVNLKDLSDSSERAALESSVAQMISKGVVQIQQAMPRIWQRVAAS